MGGALMELVAKGSQDVFLTGNPSVSYFRNVYKRHTNFAFESIQQSINGESNFGKKIECVISRSGDLLSGIILEIDLIHILEGKRGKSVSWINSIGHYILNKIELQIGGNTIDTHYGEWLEIWNELTISESYKEGYENKGKNITITDKKTLIIPLQFWFCRNYGLALPLVCFTIS